MPKQVPKTERSYFSLTSVCPSPRHKLSNKCERCIFFPKTAPPFFNHLNME